MENQSDKTYTVVAFWQMSANVRMKASSLKEAIEKVEDMEGLPSDADYVDDSFDIDKDQTRDCNPTEFLSAASLIEKLSETLSGWDMRDLQSIANKILTDKVRHINNGEFEIELN